MSDQQPPQAQSKHFFRREADDSVRLRIRFQPEAASRYEEAAGDVPIMLWIHRALDEKARRDIARRRSTANADVPPPE